MNEKMSKLYIRAQGLLSSEEGQDLVEYALVVALIALAATAGVRTYASDVNNAFSTVASTFNADLGWN